MVRNAADLENRALGALATYRASLHAVEKAEACRNRRSAIATLDELRAKLKRDHDEVARLLDLLGYIPAVQDCRQPNSGREMRLAGGNDPVGVRAGLASAVAAKARPLQSGRFRRGEV